MAYLPAPADAVPGAGARLLYGTYHILY